MGTMERGNFDTVAAWYDEQVRAGTLLHDLVLPSLFALIGDVRGQRVCDLACGQGVVARWLAGRGAAVVGVDISDKLLAIAQREEEGAPLGIAYRRDDAGSLRTIADASLDGIACNMALINITDLDAACHSVRRVLRSGGWFAFSITHPCFQTATSSWAEGESPPRRVVGGYFTEGFWRSNNPHGVRGRVGDEHRTLSTYVNTLAEAGLLIERLAEPKATGEVAMIRPGYAEIPAVLVARCRAG